MSWRNLAVFASVVTQVVCADCDHYYKSADPQRLTDAQIMRLAIEWAPDPREELPSVLIAPSKYLALITVDPTIRSYPEVFASRFGVEARFVGIAKGSYVLFRDGEIMHSEAIGSLAEYNRVLASLRYEGGFVTDGVTMTLSNVFVRVFGPGKRKPTQYDDLVFEIEKAVWFLEGDLDFSSP